VHLRVLIDGKVCRLSERTKRGWVCPNAPEPASPLSKEFSPRPHDAAVEYREVMRIIGELSESLGDRLTIKFISVNDAYASAAQRETLERLCGTDGVRRSELPERPDAYFRSKVDLMTEVPVSEDVDLDLLSIERP
jgi:hypothetical protein